MKNYTLLTAVFIVLFISCTPQKSEYHPGYYGSLGGRSSEIKQQEKPRLAEPANVLAANQQPNEGSAPAANLSPESSRTMELPATGTAFSRKKETEKGLVKADETQNPNPDANTVQANDIPPIQAPNDDENGDGFLYLTAAFMALAVMGLLRANKSRATKLTRWAKANPKKTQLLIAGIQLPLLAMGVMSGYNMKELGVEFSGTMPYLFTSLMAVGFLSLPYGAKTSSIALPKQLLRQRLAYLGIAISGLMITVGVGNSIGEKYPSSPVTQIIKKIDQSVFATADTHQIKSEKNKASHAKHKIGQNFRKWAAAGSCALAVFLILLLIITSCSGICLFIFGIYALGAGEVLGVLGLLAGAAITWLSVKGIINASKWCKGGGKDAG